MKKQKFSKDQSSNIHNQYSLDYIYAHKNTIKQLLAIPKRTQKQEEKLLKVMVELTSAPAMQKSGQIKTVKVTPNLANSKPKPAPKPKPVPKPSPTPKPNPNYPSTTGNPSGKHRGNVKKNS